MALNSFNELLAAMRSYTLREDAPFEVCLQLAEAKLQGIVRHRLMEKSVRISVAANTNGGTLPEDFCEMRSLSMDGVFLRRMSLEEDVPAKGTPDRYELVGSTIMLQPNPIAGVKLSLLYVGTIPNLSTAQPTNWLLERFPSVYLHACLEQVYIWLRDAERTAEQNALLQQALAAVQQDHMRGMNSGNTPVEVPRSWQ